MSRRFSCIYERPNHFSIFNFSDLTPLIPILISLLAPVHNQFDEAIFVPASDALQEVMSKSAMSDGSGSKTLTEPLLIWLDTWAGSVVETTLSSQFLLSSYFRYFALHLIDVCMCIL